MSHGKSVQNIRVSIHSWSSYQEKLNYSKFDYDLDSVSIHSWSSYQEKPLEFIKAYECFTFQSTPGLVTRRNGISE